MKLSVIVPVYNEKDTIGSILERIWEVAIDKEVIIVDDCSDDGTSQILKDKFRSRESFKVIRLDKNRGKGAAIREALPYVKGEFVIIQDADLEYDPQDYRKLLKPLEEDGAHVVYGTRFKGLNPFYYFIRWCQSKITGKACDVGHIYCSNYFGIQFINMMVFLLYGQLITDEATCYKAFRAEILKNMDLHCERFEFCPEVTAKVIKMGYRIHEVPISYKPRSTEHGKKLSWKDGVMAIKTLLKYRFKR